MYRVAILGATGLVGRTMIQVLEERKFPVSELVPLASEKSVGRAAYVQRQSLHGSSAVKRSLLRRSTLRCFPQGQAQAKVWAKKLPPIQAQSSSIILRHSEWKKDVPLVVPEVNPETMFKADGSIAPIIAKSKLLKRFNWWWS
jgi:aspartate-semialdehyde dehydrogenase